MKNNKELNKKKLAIKISVAIAAIGVTSFISYRLGAQHGVDVVDEFLRLHDPELFEKVDHLYKEYCC